MITPPLRALASYFADPTDPPGKIMWTPGCPGSILAGTGRAVSRLKRLIHEIRRRSLWQGLGIYLIGIWVALQGVEAFAHGLAVREWVPGFEVVVMILRLPIVLSTAFGQKGFGGRPMSGPSHLD
jgi:hypothetical protein